MKKFQDIPFVYEEKEYKIKANKVMGAIRAIDGICGYTALAKPQDHPAAISDGFHALLTYCDIKTTEEDVYFSLQSDINNYSNAVTLLLTVSQLLAVPPKSVQKYTSKKPAAKKTAKKTTKKKA